MKGSELHTVNKSNMLSDRTVTAVVTISQQRSATQPPPPPPLAFPYDTVSILTKIIRYHGKALCL